MPATFRRPFGPPADGFPPSFLHRLYTYVSVQIRQALIMSHPYCLITSELLSSQFGEGQGEGEEERGKEDFKKKKTLGPVLQFISQ